MAGLSWSLQILNHVILQSGILEYYQHYINSAFYLNNQPFNVLI